MKVFLNLGNVDALKLLISATHNEKHLDVNIVKPDEKIVPYLHRPKLPILEVSPSKFLFSTNAAARLLYSTSDADAGLLDQWLEWESGLLQPAVYHYVAASLTKSKDPGDGRLRKLLTSLQDTLQTSYLIGDKLSLVDVVIWASVFPILNESSPASALRADYKSLGEWFNKLAKQPAFSQAVQTIFEGKITDNLKEHFSSMPVPPLGDVKLPRSQDNKAEQKSPTESVSSEQFVTEQELASATDAWQNGSSKVNKPRQLAQPILPVEGDRNILVTSALPYVNNVPHLGNIIGCVLSADVFARYCRLRNYNTLYVCGTDEYGTATETKAVEEGLTPRQICDKYNKLHTEIYQWFNCGFDYFGRTTTEQQTKIAQDIFWGLQKNGHVLKDSVEQLQCEKCVRFLADRFVEGICPLCGYEDARGDQCDKCGKLLNATDLLKPKCKVCGDTPAIKTSHHLFLDLPTLEPKLSSYLDQAFQKGIWTSNCKVITKSWIRDGLKPRCISRDLKWGTPVPLEGYTNKVFYVWYDAPIGYISITANYTEHWEKWWKNPEQVQYYQFMAKDNVPFHSVIFPCTLLGTDEPWTMVNHLSATEYLNYEDGKFSKSRGVGVFGNNAKDTGIPADIWRFYLLFLRPESQDSSFCWDDFATKNNSELLNNLGNFINRALMFVSNSFAGTIPVIQPVTEDFELMALITRELKAFIENLEKIKLRDGIRNILSISRLGNQYMQANKPWVLVKGSETEKTRAGTVVGLAANVACLLSVMLQPYMPEVSNSIQTQLNAPADCNVLITDFVCFLPSGHKIGKPSPLFQKIEQAQIDGLKEKFKGQQDNKAVAAATANPAEAERLTAEVAKQGEVVRQLKTAKAEKSAIDTEVAKLLDLKRQLTAAQGGAAPAQAQGGKKKGKPGKQTTGQQQPTQAPSKPALAVAPAGPTNPAEIERLTAEVTKQGEKVREVKANKAEKSIIDAEVATLLSLKRELAVAQGLNPDEQQGGGKKKKQGKKK